MAGDPDPESARDALEGSREAAVRLMSEALTVTAAAGGPVEATGAWTECGMQPSTGLQYVVGARTGAAGTVAAQDREVRRVADALVAAGWTESDSGVEPYSYAQFERDGGLLSVNASPRAVVPVEMSVRGACVPTTTELDEELLGQQDRVLPEG